MNTGKGSANSRVIVMVISALVVIALVVAMVFILKGCQGEPPVQGGNPSQTDTSGTDSGNGDTSVTDDTSAGTSDPEVITYTVTFKDYDGTILKSEMVEKGKAATAPADPKREHFTFAGWDKSFKDVTSDTVVTATYTTTKAVVYAESVAVNKGTGEVTVNVRVINNPGILGAALKVSIDDKVFSFKSAGKEGYPGLTLTSPAPGITASPYTFLLDAVELGEEDKKDGILFTVTFTVKDTSVTGAYNVTLSFDNGAVFNENYKDAKVALENGKITIR